MGEWRYRLGSPFRTLQVALEETDGELAAPVALARVVEALTAAGARAVIVVPLWCDPELGFHVVRVVPPPLLHGRAS